MSSIVEVARLTRTKVRPAESLAQVPVMAMSPYDGRSMTSMKTKKLNRSAVKSPPMTPVSSMSESAG